MRKFFRFTAILICAAFIVPLFSCGKTEMQQLAETLSTYKITAEYDDSANTLTADMELNFINGSKSIMDEIKFHLYPSAYRQDARFSPFDKNSLAAAYPNGISYGGITVNSLSVAGAEKEIKVGGQDEDILNVALSEGLYPTDSVKINMNFTVTVPNARHRLGYYDGSVNLGNFYPIVCAFSDSEGFDESPYYSNGDPFNSDLSNYEVSITASDKFSAAMTGAVTVTESSGKKTFTSSESCVRDFAAVLGEFSSLGTKTSGGVNVMYYYKNDEAAHVSLQAAIDSINTFSDLYGSYPYKNYTVVETNFLQGGMEYPTLSYISNELTQSVYIETIIHETAHQWWYGAVGSDQISNAWMDEGLSEFSTTVFYELNPSYEINADRRFADALSAYILYCDAFKHPDRDTTMTRKLGDYTGAAEYNLMSYVKGELLFDALRELIGKQKFNDSLKEYYSKYSMKTATPDDMISCFESVSARPLKSFFSSWLDGKVKMFGGVTG